MHPLSTVQGATTSRAHDVARIHAGNVSRRSLRAKVFTTTCEKFTAVSVSNFIRPLAVSMYCILYVTRLDLCLLLSIRTVRIYLVSLICTFYDHGMFLKIILLSFYQTVTVTCTLDKSCR